MTVSSVPTTVSRFEDGDDCPDEVPAEVIEFTGAIKGTYYDFNRPARTARCRRSTALPMLTESPSIYVEISGHTDSVDSTKIQRDEHPHSRHLDRYTTCSIILAELTRKRIPPPRLVTVLLFVLVTHSLQYTGRFRSFPHVLPAELWRQGPRAPSPTYIGPMYGILSWEWYEVFVPTPR